MSDTFRYHVEVTPKRAGVRVGIVPVNTLGAAKALAVSIRDGAQGSEYQRILVWAVGNHPLAEREARPVFVAKS